MLVGMFKHLILKVYVTHACFISFGLTALHTLDNDVDVKFTFGGDFHGTFREYPREDDSSVGGVARFMTALQYSGESIFIYVGNIVKKRTEDEKKIKLAQKVLKMIRPSVIILGKNEFSMLDDSFKKFVNETPNLIMSCNLDHKETQFRQNKLFKIGNLSILVFGYTSEDVENLPTADTFHVQSIIETLNDKVQLSKLTHKEPHLYVAAGCTGIESAKKIAESTRYVRVIFSSCSPNLLWNAKNGSDTPENISQYGDMPLIVTNLDNEKVVVAHSFGSTKFLGELTLKINKTVDITQVIGNMLYLDDTTIPNEKMEQLMKSEPQPWLLKTGTIGEARVLLDGACAKTECNLGNMIADAFIEYRAVEYEGNFWTDTPIALIAGGNINGNVNATAQNGNIIAEELSLALPDIYKLVIFDIKGKHLIQAIEYGINVKFKTDVDKFLQFAGLRIIFDTRREPGHRLVSIKARCGLCSTPGYSPVKDQDTYKVITTENLANGDFGHKILATKSFNVKSLSVTSWDVLLRYLENRTIRGGNTDRIIQHLPPKSHHTNLLYSSSVLIVNMLLCW